MASTKEAHLTCRCGAVQENGTLLEDENFPSETDLCHCNVDRHGTGGLFCTTANLNGSPSEKSLANCTIYNASEKLNRYFCSTCGSYCFLKRNEENTWAAFSGIIDPPTSNSDVIKVTFQAFLADTGDGLLPRRLYREGIPCYSEWDNDPPMTKEQVLNPPQPPSQQQQQQGDKLEAKCRCGAVAFHLARPDHTGWHARYTPPAGQRDKYLAGFCCCRSCRLALGAASVQPWLFAAPKSIIGPDGQPVRFSWQDGTALPGVRDYRNSVTAAAAAAAGGEEAPFNVLRSFCTTCGATVFYWADDQPDVVDVAVGLLRAPEGAMAAGWVVWDWDRKALRAEEQVDAALVEALADPQS